MSNKHGISASRQVSAWNKTLKVNFKDFFTSLTKAATQGVAGSFAGASKDAIDAISAISLGKEHSSVAWLLIYRSLIQAVYTLVEENEALIMQDSQNPRVIREKLGVPVDDPDALVNQLDLTLETRELIIDENFFDRPRDFPVLEDIKTPFSQWLKGFGLSDAQASAITDHLPSYFVFALNDQWRNRPEDYVVLKEAFDTPFTRASEREQAWTQYSAWLKKQIDEPMFDEAFSLSQVYVPLRAYYERKVEEKKERPTTVEDKRPEKVVVELEETLSAWLDKNDSGDALRVISGGPGSGKSSFTKMFAAHLTEKNERRVLFVPLHLFEPSEDLVEAIGNFVRLGRLLPHNPLDPEVGDSQLFIIFDGLDELTMQGKLAAETAQQFVTEVQRKTELLNSKNHPRLKVLISGRDLAVQSNANLLRKPQQILYVLPYLVDNDQSRRVASGSTLSPTYVDQKKLLDEDQRQKWWELYGKARGKNYSGMPEELAREDFVEITSQPLLNYLVALSFDRNVLNLAEESNLNRIYEDLLKAVYERKWAKNPHPATVNVEEDDFIRVLEEVAIAAWHGDGRKTTVREIEAHCEASGLKDLLDALQEGASKGVTRLLMAFYFRQAGSRTSGDRTFEFTHKSFGEYLTARRIVDVVRQLHSELQRRPKLGGGSFNEQLALEHWIRLCGQVALDEYVFNFIKNEMILQDAELVAGWQETLIRLINYMLLNGMPMERMNPRPSYQEEARQARNAEETLLAALNACAKLTGKISKITWPSYTAFGEWISRLQPQRSGGRNVLAMSCLSYLDLQESVLHMQDFYSADLSYSNLCRASLGYAIFQDATLIGTNFSEADIHETDFRDVNAREANFESSMLFYVTLQNANLPMANFADIIDRGSNFESANLGGANFEKAHLDESSFKKANLEGANFADANLTGANFEKAHLKGAILNPKPAKEGK
jgi:hypothetical protein